MKSWKILCAASLLALSAQAGAVGGLADVAVFDRTEGRVLPIHWHEGRAHVAGRPGNEYSVRIRNRAREEVLAVVSVDGVPCFSEHYASERAATEGWTRFKRQQARR